MTNVPSSVLHNAREFRSYYIRKRLAAWTRKLRARLASNRAETVSFVDVNRA